MVGSQRRHLTLLGRSGKAAWQRGLRASLPRILLRRQGTLAGSVPGEAWSLFESLNGRPTCRENQIQGSAPKRSLFPPVS